MWRFVPRRVGTVGCCGGTPVAAVTVHPPARPPADSPPWPCRPLCTAADSGPPPPPMAPCRPRRPDVAHSWAVCVPPCEHRPAPRKADSVPAHRCRRCYLVVVIVVVLSLAAARLWLWPCAVLGWHRRLRRSPPAVAETLSQQCVDTCVHGYPSAVRPPAPAPAPVPAPPPPLPLCGRGGCVSVEPHVDSGEALSVCRHVVMIDRLIIK